jgi:leucyl-tRNA synthetase
MAGREDLCRRDRGDPRPSITALVEFPYPSGQGLHVGHPRPYTAMDIIWRAKADAGLQRPVPHRLDAFGLPTENYAIKNHMHPPVT